jgi:hypothetical protein
MIALVRGDAEQAEGLLSQSITGLEHRGELRATAQVREWRARTRLKLRRLDALEDVTWLRTHGFVVPPELEDVDGTEPH